MRLLTAADVEIFGGRGFAFIGAALVSMIGMMRLTSSALSLSPKSMRDV
jgi:hypothetical protein